MSNENTNSVVEQMDNILKRIDRINESFIYGVWVPSLNKEISFRELTTGQQKRLVKSIVDSPIYSTQFILTLREILKENCADTTVDIDQLNLIDKLFIAMKIRSTCVNDIVEFTFNEKTKRGLSLEKLIEEKKKEIQLPSSAILSDEQNNYTLQCSLPTILTEAKLEEEIRNNVENEKINFESPQEVRQMLGDVLIGEVVKFITSLSIRDGEQIIQINFNDISFRNRIALVEKLPAKLIDKLMQYISETKKTIEKITLWKFEIDDKSISDVEKEVHLTIDGRFFIKS